MSVKKTSFRTNPTLGVSSNRFVFGKNLLEITAMSLKGARFPKPDNSAGAFTRRRVGRPVAAAAGVGDGAGGGISLSKLLRSSVAAGGGAL